MGDPTTDATSYLLGTCLNLLAAFVGAVITILVKFAPDAHFLEIQHTADFFAGLVFSPPLLAVAGTPAELFTLRVASAGSVMAILGISALCLFTHSYQRGDVARVSVVNYVEV